MTSAPVAAVQLTVLAPSATSFTDCCDPAVETGEPPLTRQETLAIPLSCCVSEATAVTVCGPDTHADWDGPVNAIVGVWKSRLTAALAARPTFWALSTGVQDASVVPCALTVSV